uniref:Uncharacterized protein n=1 Tax=Sparus aurata TaxID=8175 RepID=A0A671WS17_SPAAU
LIAFHTADDGSQRVHPPKKLMSVISCSCRWKRQVNCRSPRTFLERRSHDPPGESPEILICQIDFKTTCVHFFRNFLAVVVDLFSQD